MDKTVNQKAWLLVLPVFLVVAFSAVLPLMTVVNYSMQDTFGNNQFFWNGVGWFKELLDPSTDLGSRFFASLWRNLFFSAVILAIQVPLGIVVALSMPRQGWQVAACLVILALPLLIPWNVVGTIWQIFGRPDIGLLGYTLNSIGINYNYVSNEFDAWATVISRPSMASSSSTTFTIKNRSTEPVSGLNFASISRFIPNVRLAAVRIACSSALMRTVLSMFLSRPTCSRTMSSLASMTLTLGRAFSCWACRACA